MEGSIHHSMANFMEYSWPPHSRSGNVTNITNSGIYDKNATVQALKSRILSENPENLDIPTNDHHLLKFLYARRCNVDDAFTLLKNYHTHRKLKPDLFNNLNFAAYDIKYCLENCLPSVLPLKDRKGRSVVIFNASNWDERFNLLAVYRSLVLSLECLIDDVHNQTNGIVVIVDWTEFTFRQSLRLRPSQIRVFIDGLQDCFPAKFKGVHFINQPWYVETALRFIKPFLKEEMKDRIYLHGNNLSTLHEWVHRDVLPAELGGEQPSLNPMESISSLRNNGPRQFTALITSAGTKERLLYPNPLSINTPKYNDLVKLCDKKVIPKRFAEEHKKFKHESTVSDTLPETDEEDALLHEDN